MLFHYRPDYRRKHAITIDQIIEEKIKMNDNIKRQNFAWKLESKNHCERKKQTKNKNKLLFINWNNF